MENGIIGITTIYIIITALLLWFVILSKGRFIIKCCVIALSIWYAVVLYSFLPNLEGWPTAEDIPDGSQIISIRIVEPSGENLGAFYFWCNTKPEWKQDAINIINPLKLFIYTGIEQPRAFELPYDRELHKKILEAKEKQKKEGGSWIQIKKGKKKGTEGDGKENQSEIINFRIINPISILVKE